MRVKTFGEDLEALDKAQDDLIDAWIDGIRKVAAWLAGKIRR